MPNRVAGLDNRKENLRIVDRKGNARNARSHRDSKSRFKGVNLHKQTGKWHAKIYADGRFYHLGLFKDEEQAAHAYDEAACQFHGSTANLNFPR